MMGSFFLGQEVAWKSQSQGYWKEKRGKIVAVVPPGMSPEEGMPAGCRLNNPGGRRHHESYLVQIGARSILYWPLVSALSRGSGATMKVIGSISLGTEGSSNIAPSTMELIERLESRVQELEGRVTDLERYRGVGSCHEDQGNRGG
jgi:hypothetical protein